MGIQIAPSDQNALAGFWIAKAELTDTTPNTTSAGGAQWGSEEATVLSADTGAVDVTVLAWLAGRVKFNTSTTGRRGRCWIEISLDGGSTWQTGWVGSSNPLPTQPGIGTNGRITQATHALVTGTVTGDVLARGLCGDVESGGETTWEGGRILMQVFQG